MTDNLHRYDAASPAEKGSYDEVLFKREAITFNPAVPYVLTVVLLLVAAISIVVMTAALWELPSGNNGVWATVLCLFIGMLLSLPLLLALWAVLGGQVWIIRVPLAAFALFALLGVYLATMKSLDSTIPIEVPWLIGGIALAVTVAIQIPLWIVRAWKGVVISREGDRSATKMQFTIKQLLITTTIFAFAAPLFQWLATFEGGKAVFRAPVYEIAGFCGIFIVVMAFLTLLSVLFVFLPNLRGWSLGILVVGIAAIPFAVVPVLDYTIRFPGSTSWIEVSINTVVFSISNAVTMIAVLWLYYAIGFRLSKRSA